MNRLFFTLMTITCLSFITQFYAAEQTLNVKTLTGHKFTIPFTHAITIAQVKEAIKDSEGVPVNMQRLRKPEGWVLGLPPKQLTTLLEDDQTCSDYDLQHNTVVTLSLLSHETIEAEAKARAEQIAAKNKARKEAMIEILLESGLLTKDPLSIAIEYAHEQ